VLVVQPTCSSRQQPPTSYTIHHGLHWSCICHSTVTHSLTLSHGLPYSALRHCRSAGTMYPSAACYGFLVTKEQALLLASTSTVSSAYPLRMNTVFLFGLYSTPRHIGFTIQICKSTSIGLIRLFPIASDSYIYECSVCKYYLCSCSSSVLVLGCEWSLFYILIAYTHIVLSEEGRTQVKMTYMCVMKKPEASLICVLV
jgi:hypothetical protein